MIEYFQEYVSISICIGLILFVLSYFLIKGIVAVVKFSIISLLILCMLFFLEPQLYKENINKEQIKEIILLDKNLTKEELANKKQYFYHIYKIKNLMNSKIDKINIDKSIKD